jgi:ATP adenylyltransferase
MHVLWAPWRMTYIAGPKAPGCLFCSAGQTADPRQSLVLVQQPAVVMLNRYPYTSGHLMVAPRRHAADLGALPADEFHSLMQVLQRATGVLAAAFRPDGMNVGMNLGSAAGAGVADHLHWHLVPRWTGDTNFMPMLAEVRVMPEHLDATYERLLPLFA